MFWPVTTVSLDPFWNPWTWHWNSWRFISGAVDWFQGVSSLPEWHVGDNRLFIPGLAPFSCYLHPSAFPKRTECGNRQTWIPPLAPPAPPAPSLPQKLTPCGHTSDLRRLYYSSTSGVPTEGQALYSETSCIASFHPHIPYGVGSIIISIQWR